MGGMGAGDAKLMGVAGAVLGIKGVFIAGLFAALVGGMYAVILLIIKPSFSNGFIHRRLLTLKTYLKTRQFIFIPTTKEEEKPKLCYGVAIAIGTLIYISLETAGYQILA
jgi:prepilin peptidase CpaA